MAIPAGHVSNVREIITLQGHILEQQAHHPEATGTLSWILSALSISAKMIASQVRRARLEDVLGQVGAENVQGEQQVKLDVASNDVILKSCDWGGLVAGMASEELDDPYPIPAEYPRGRFLLVFDPLDGSSNADVNVSVGTIFSHETKRRFAAMQSRSSKYGSGPRN